MEQDPKKLYRDLYQQVESIPWNDVIEAEATAQREARTDESEATFVSAGFAIAEDDAKRLVQAWDHFSESGGCGEAWELLEEVFGGLIDAIKETLDDDSE